VVVVREDGSGTVVEVVKQILDSRAWIERFVAVVLSVCCREFAATKAAGVRGEAELGDTVYGTPMYDLRAPSEIPNMTCRIVWKPLQIGS